MQDSRVTKPRAGNPLGMIQLAFKADNTKMAYRNTKYSGARRTTKVNLKTEDSTRIKLKIMKDPSFLMNRILD